MSVLNEFIIWRLKLCYADQFFFEKNPIIIGSGVFFKPTKKIDNTAHVNQEPTPPVEWKYDARRDMFYCGKSLDELAAERKLKSIAEKKDGPQNK